MSLNPSLATEIQKLAPSAVVELFELDCTSLGGDLLRFHAGTNGLSQNVVWQGHTYVRYPVQASGFEFAGQGSFPRPKLLVSNFLSAITLLASTYKDLIGAKVTRKRTMAKFLDAVNFTGGVNANADPTAEIQDDVYFIDRKSSEDRDAVEFELASAIDLVGVQLPRRQIVQNVCLWKYRGAECGFTGGPLYDQDGVRIVPTTSAGIAFNNAYNALTAAQVTLASAEITLSAAARGMGGVCDYHLSTTAYQTSSPKSAVMKLGGGAEGAYIADALVTLGTVYRRGAYRGQVLIGDFYFDTWEIQTWAVDTAGCTAATTAYNSALTARNNAAAAVTSAQTAYNSALAALPPSDPMYLADRCGKRLSSCKLRFGDQAQLPYGSFPGVGLIR